MRAFISQPLRFSSLFVAVGLTLVCTAVAVAVDSTWIGGTTGNWNNATNWDNGIPNNNSFNAFIDSNAGQDSTVTVATTPTIGELTIDAGDAVSVSNDSAIRIEGPSIDNSGTLAINATDSDTDFYIPGTVTLTGGGVVFLSDSTKNYIRDDSGTNAYLINQDNTIQGAGQIGHNTLALTNRGTIDANASNPVTIDPNANGVLNDTGGVLCGSGVGGLSLTGGQFNNLGTVEALNGSHVTYSNSATTANNDAGELKLGAWRSVATGGGATVSIMGTAVHTIGENTEVELSGVGSVFRVRQGTTSNFTTLENSLQTNKGTLRILKNRDWTNVNNFANQAAGTLELGGGTFDVATAVLDNAGEIYGYGTIIPTPSNSGLIRAAGGTLVCSGGILAGSGTVQVDPGASLDLSAAGAASNADYLIHDGADLNLGGNDFLVRVDYTNANWGLGNSFDHRTNVSGGGQIRADQTISQWLTGDVANGGTNSPTMDFGKVHVGDSVTKHYQIANSGPLPDTPNLRGAIQTAGAGGGNISDPRLTGSGVTAGNFGPVAPEGATGDLDVTLEAISAGRLSNQRVNVTNNFDNVNAQMLYIDGEAYRLANPTAHTPEPVNFGNLHVGEVAEQALSITNDVPADGYSESLNGSIGSPTGDATTNSGWFNMLGPGATDNTGLMVGIDTSTAGAKAGTATISLESDGTGASDLGITPLPDQTVNVQAQVNNYARAAVVHIAGDGTLSMATPTAYDLDFGSVQMGDPPSEAELGILNDVPDPADLLAGSWALAAPDFELSGFDPFADVAAGETQGGLMVGLDTDVLGDFSGTLTLYPLSENVGGYSGPLPSVIITLQGSVVAEPGTIALLVAAGVCLLGYRWRSQRGGKAQPAV